MSVSGTIRLARPFLPVAAAQFCVQLDFFSLNLALPTIARDLDTSVTDLQWMLSGYMLAVGSLLIPAARAADIIGRRTVLMAGVAVFGLTSLVCGVVSSVPILIAARVAQGVGAAMILPTAFALVTNATDEDERPRILGVLLGVSGVGMALGPVVGGVLAGTLGWRWVFLLNVPIAVVALWGGRHLPTSRDETGPRTLAGIDWWGVVTIVGGLSLVSLAIDDVSVQGWTSPETLGPLVGGVVLLAVFALHETRASAPLVRPALLRNRVYVLIVAASTLANIGAVVFILAATLDLQQVRGLSASESGLLFVFGSTAMAVSGPVAGFLGSHLPPARTMGIVLVLCAPSMVLLAVATPLPLFVVAMALCGITTATGFTLGELAVQNVLPAARSAEGTSVLLTAQVALSGLSIVIATAVIESGAAGVVTESGLTRALVAAAVLLLVVGVSTVAMAGRPLAAPDAAPPG